MPEKRDRTVCTGTRTREREVRRTRREALRPLTYRAGGGRGIMADRAAFARPVLNYLRQPRPEIFFQQ